MPLTRVDLGDLFTRLAKHYEDKTSIDLKLTLTIKDIKKVYQHLDMVNDSSNGSNQHF